MRMLMTIIGVLAVIIGLVWMGQGSGYFPYPASSFMIAQTQWIAYGAVLIVIGALLIWRGRRSRQI
jgi:uncharacterized membrane protein